MSRSFLVCTAALALLTACPGDDSSDDSDTAAMTDSNASNSSPTSTSGETDESMTGASMTSSNPTTEPMTTEPMTTEPMTTDATTGMTTEPTTGMTTAMTTGEDACAPEADDDECSMCLKDVCCDELTTCRANPDCACIIDCLDELGKGVAGLPTCQDADHCDVEGLPPGGIELSACQAQMCKACG